MIDIFSSLPLRGAVSAQTDPVVNGIKLALAQAGNRAGQFTVNYESLDDSKATSAVAECDMNQSESNARKAAADSKLVYYIGEFNSGCSQVVIPILNVAGVPQVSPSNTYVGLTTRDPGSAPGEPGKYYPTGVRTYLRISARDTVEADALLVTMRRDRCGGVAIAEDRIPYGAGMAAVARRDAARYRVHIVSITGIDSTAPNYRRYAAMVKRQRAGCFLYAGNLPGAVQLTKDVSAAIPKAKLYGAAGTCFGLFTDGAEGGIPRSLGRRFECTQSTLAIRAYPGGRAFLAAYKARYGITNPDPYSIYGYEAMKLALDTIAGLGANGNDRTAILRALFAIKNRHSVLGIYSFDRNGDTTLRTCGLYRVGADGLPSFVRNVMPR